MLEDFSDIMAFNKPQQITVTSREELKQLIKEQTGDFVISILLELEVPDER